MSAFVSASFTCALMMLAANEHLINPILRATPTKEIEFRISIEYGVVTIAKLGPARRFNANVAIGYADIHAGIVELLESARRASARAINALMTATYWEIGRRIIEAEQVGKRRADYGERLIARLAGDLTKRFGRVFGVDSLKLIRLFYLKCPIA